MSDPPAYLAPYARAAREHGGSFESTLWASRAYQRIRFEVMAQLVDFHGAVVLDAGAGRGDLAAHLQERGVRWRRYIALEAVEPMARAIEALQLPDVEVQRVDFVRDKGAFARLAPEIIVFSGSLNTLSQSRALRVLERAYAAASRAVVFNFLSDRGPAGRSAAAPAQRFDTLKVLRWALGLTPCLAFRHEYLGGHDATIALWKTCGPQAEPEEPAPTG